MFSLETLQIYWWLIIAVLGSLLVFLLFVQGGQSMLLCRLEPSWRDMMVNSLGRKWELTFTTLVVFGGAFFAAFPLFYSTSFGGAYWLWMLILISFVLQAVSYEFRSKPSNLLGQRTYDTFLFINGCFGCILLGVAVGTIFFGGAFTVSKGNILDASAPVISSWAPTHGLEAIADWRNLLLGVMVLFLARTQAAFYFLSNIDDRAFDARCRKSVLINGAIFVVLFLVFLFVLLTANGMAYADGTFTPEPYKYLNNYIDMWYLGVLLALGVVVVLYAYLRTILSKEWRHGIWFSGIGTVVVVLTLFCVAGYNGTCYYPSTLDAASSLNIQNSSSTHFTLTVMSWVSLLVPFVVAYIAYVWYSMDRKAITPSEMDSTDHKY